MRVGREPVGRLGLGVLAITGIAGVVLAVHGWAGRAAGLAPGALTGPGGHATAARHPARTGGPGPAARSPKPHPTSPAGHGPLLSSEPYANYAYAVWPGRPGAQARQALTGLRVSVHRHGAGILVAAGLSGQPLPAPRLYATGARVYIVEAALGDDSGNSDYNLGDDGLVVTDVSGRVSP